MNYSIFIAPYSVKRKLNIEIINERFLIFLIQSKSEVQLNIDFISGDSPEGPKAVITAIDKDKSRHTSSAKEEEKRMEKEKSFDKQPMEKEKSFDKKSSMAKSSRGSSRDQSKDRKSVSSSDGEKSSNRSSISDEEKVA
jgi:hypothetical protein